MPTIHYDKLLKAYEKAGTQRGNKLLRESYQAGDASPYDMDFGKLFAECFGWNEFHHCRSTGRLAGEVMEAAGAVSTASFQQISQQTIYSMIMDSYQSPDFVASRMIPTPPATNVSFEKIPGVTELGDEVTEVNEGDDYPVAGVAETYRHRPELKKRGFKVLLTREVLFFDKTARVQDRCAGGGKSMGQNREKRAWDCIIDENGGAKSAVLGGHRYHYRGNSIATFGNSSGNHDWDNLAASNALVDWTDVDAAQQLINAAVDPDTAEPIIFSARHLACAQELEMAALRVRNATEITVHTGGYATSGNLTETKSTNPFGGRFEVVTSPYAASRLATDTSWFYGDIAAAFEYVQAWAEEVKTLAGGSQLEFDRDIVQQYRFSELGNYGTKEPRGIVKSTA